MGIWGVKANPISQHKLEKRNVSFTTNFLASIHKSFSTTVSPSVIDPWFLTGFTDAEGYFGVNVLKNSASTLGYRVNLTFTIGLHNKDLALLEKIRDYFNGIGNITKLGEESSQFRVTSIEELRAIIDHFDTYPLLTQKGGDFLLFKQIYNMIVIKQHLSLEGLNNIIAHKASMNLGLSESLKESFSMIIPVTRPIIPVVEIPSPYWFTGFVCRDGCFMVSIGKSKTVKSGFFFRLFFFFMSR